MDIYSIKPSQSFGFRNHNRNNTRPEELPQPAKAPKAAFEVLETVASGPDFTAISIGDIREIARQNFDQGKIDYDTFYTLSEGLPMHAIDTNGNIIDLSEITERTPFNFRDYYQNQLRIANSIGDARTAQTLQAIVRFLNSN